MKTFNEFVAKFNDGELDILISDYEYLTKIGSIGNCLLRSSAEEWNEIISGHSVILIMDQLAFEAYKKRYHQLRNVL